jgi:hypothetical protein
MGLFLFDPKRKRFPWGVARARELVILSLWIRMGRDYTERYRSVLNSRRVTA